MAEDNHQKEYSRQGWEPLPELARRLTKATERGKGLRLSATDVDLMIINDVLDLLQTAAARLLKEKTLCREVRDLNAFKNAGGTGLIGTAGKTAPSAPPTSQSFGMTPSENVSEALQRAQRIFKKGNVG